MFRHRLLLVAGLALSACGGGGTSTPTPLATAPATSSSVVVATTPGATAAGVTTASSTSAEPSTAAAEVTLSPEGPWRLVDSAPGITTPGLVYELMPKLWVYLPTEEDIPNGITWTLTEPDRPIIEAYLQARLAYFQAATQRPMDLDSHGWSTWFTPTSSLRSDLSARAVRGEWADLAMGVVLQPEVLGEGRSDSTAVVVDCTLDGGVFRQQDGSLAAGSIEGVVPSGLAFEVLRQDGQWRLGEYGTQSEVCP